MTKREDGRWVETMVFTVNGRKQRKYFYGATKREVLDKIAIFEAGKEQGRYWQEVIDEWWEKYQPTLAYNSVRNTAPAYQRARLCFEGKRMKQITPSMVKTALDKLVAKNHMAKKTASTQLGVFRLAFRYAVLCDEITESPAREVMIPEGLEHTRRELPSRHDVQIIAGTQGKGGMAELYAFMALYTGLRQGELLGLTWDDINIADRLIYIRRSVYSKDGKGYTKEPKTQAGIRIVPILDELLPALNAKEKKSGKLFSSD
ncbi:MAG: tyrosine-type recombinase/integrase, partial [Oscillospiraceae bacterium]|nr:tyrosine-type recombinase/integrase [Oscillospiraceae bacterium]